PFPIRPERRRINLIHLPRSNSLQTSFGKTLQPPFPRVIRMSISVEIYPAVTVNGLCANAFISRVANVDVATDREEALRRLAPFHEKAREDLGFADMPFLTAEQVHGDGVAI